MQVILLCKTCLPSDVQPIYNKNVTVVSPADVNKWKQRRVFFARLKTSQPLSNHGRTLWSSTDSRSFQSWASTVRAACLILQMHKFEGSQLIPASGFKRKANGQSLWNVLGLDVLAEKPSVLWFHWETGWNLQVLGRSWIWSFQSSLAKW